MDLVVPHPIAPMLAKNARRLPQDDGWVFEPKWDGFRCLVFRDGDEVELQSRSQKSLTRYFPELLDPLRDQLPTTCVLDGEVVVRGLDGALDFDMLGQRIHPAESRITLLSEQTPADVILFDVLAVGSTDLRSEPFSARRARLEALLGEATAPIHLTPATTDHVVASDWFQRFEGAGLDGVIGKPADDPYAAGKRTLLKLKHQRTADVVVAGYRTHKSGDGVGSLLLGLYRDNGDLQHIGVASSFSVKRRGELVDELAPYVLDDVRDHPWSSWMSEEAHEGQRLPGAPNRWSGKRDHDWTPLRCDRVAEVTFNQLTEGRLRHPAKFLRWRDDREPTSCTHEQLEVAVPAELEDVLGA